MKEFYAITQTGSPTKDEFLERVREVATDRGWRPGDLDGWEMSEEVNFADAASSFGLNIDFRDGIAVIFDPMLTADAAFDMVGRHK